MCRYKVALQENGCSYSHQTFITCAVNIYYQINAKKTIFHVFGVDAPLHRQFGTHHACDIILAVPEVINTSSSPLVSGDWIANA